MNRTFAIFCLLGVNCWASELILPPGKQPYAPIANPFVSVPRYIGIDDVSSALRGYVLQPTEPVLWLAGHIIRAGENLDLKQGRITFIGCSGSQVLFLDGDDRWWLSWPTSPPTFALPSTPRYSFGCTAGPVVPIIVWNLPEEEAIRLLASACDIICVTPRKLSGRCVTFELLASPLAILDYIVTTSQWQVTKAGSVFYFHENKH